MCNELGLSPPSPLNNGDCYNIGTQIPSSISDKFPGIFVELIWINVLPSWSFSCRRTCYLCTFLVQRGVMEENEYIITSNLRYLIWTTRSLKNHNIKRCAIYRQNARGFVTGLNDLYSRGTVCVTLVEVLNQSRPNRMVILQISLLNVILKETICLLRLCN